jgi:Domain of unknown function (DUF4418)
MKKRVFGLSVAACGVLLLLVPTVIFPVCGVGRYAPPDGQSIGHHGCHATLHAEIIIGILIMLVGVVAAIWQFRAIRIVGAIVLAVLAILIALFPLGITGVCKISSMPCRLGTVPGLCTMAILIGILATGSLISKLMERPGGSDR